MLKKLYMPTQPVVYLTLLKMAKSLTRLLAWRVQNVPLILANQKYTAAGTALTGTGNYFHILQSHSGMNNLAKSTCHI